jgi:CHAD domain-containing protein
MENHLLAKSAALFVGLEHCAKLPDVESLHRLRVTSRRLRVGLRMFADLFPDTERRQCCRQLRRLTRTLGAVRTLDVNLRELRRARRHLQPETQEAQVRAARMLLAEREAALKEVRELSGLLRKSGLSARLERMIRFTQRRWRTKQLLNVMRQDVARLRDTALRRERDWEKKQGRRAFHRLRIAVKKYRYGLEMAEGVFGASVKSRLEAVEQLQDLMGACHDVEVLLEWFTSAKWDKSLAKPVGWIASWLEEEREARRQEAVRFLKKERIWMKKVRLECENE